jgi:glycosyltransferase involved in cell wall biosynthesis
MKLLPVSYFIPSYNCESTVIESVKSIIDTNLFEGDEIIMTNDCSTDNTGLILDSLSTTYPFIKVIHNTRNRGGGATRNICIEHANNSLLFCLDSDNLLASNSMKSLRQLQVKTDADIVSFQEMRFFSKSKDVYDFTWKFNETTTLSDILADYRNPASSGNYLFTKDSWLKANGYPEYSKALDTWGFGLYQLITGAKMIALPDSYYLHRHGLESYYIRDMKSRNMSLSALQVLLPYLEKIHPDDIEYIMSKEARYIWLEKLLERPLRTSDNVLGHQIKQITYNHKPTKVKLIKRILRKLDKLIPD